MRAGQSVVTMGTSGAVRQVVAQPLLDRAERTWCYVLMEGRWFAGGHEIHGQGTFRFLQKHLGWPK